MKKTIAVVLLGVSSACYSSEVSLVLHCVAFKDDSERLACYDKVGEYAKLLEKADLAKKFDAKEFERDIKKASEEIQKNGQ